MSNVAFKDLPVSPGDEGDKSQRYDKAYPGAVGTMLSLQNGSVLPWPLAATKWP